MTESAHVRVLPSGHEFRVEGGDTLLQAGLKAGLTLGYGCGTGTCGLCKARVISGELRQVAHSDFRIPEQERNQGVRLLCTHTAVGEVVVETLEAAGPADIPVQEVVARVRAVTPLSRDTRLLHLQTPRSQRLRFLAGQSATLLAPSPDGRNAAANGSSETLPLASCPCDERNLHFHIADDAPGPWSRRITRSEVQPGQEIAVRGPFGSFVLESSSTRPPLFACCDTAFAPVKSLIEQAIALDEFDTIGLYRLATRAGGHYLDNLCRSWAGSLDRFRYAALADASPVQGAKQLAARILTDETRLGDCLIYIAGPKDFVQTLSAALAGAGMKRDAMKLSTLSATP